MFISCEANPSFPEVHFIVLYLFSISKEFSSICHNFPGWSFTSWTFFRPNGESPVWGFVFFRLHLPSPLAKVQFCHNSAQLPAFVLKESLNKTKDCLIKIMISKSDIYIKAIHIYWLNYIVKGRSKWTCSYVQIYLAFKSQSRLGPQSVLIKYYTGHWTDNI